jgi:hypothetical protein
LNCTRILKTIQVAEARIEGYLRPCRACQSGRPGFLRKFDCFSLSGFLRKFDRSSLSGFLRKFDRSSSLGEQSQCLSHL